MTSHVSPLEREVLSWVGSLFRPSTSEIVGKVRKTNPKAGQSVRRAIYELEAKGMIRNDAQPGNEYGDTPNQWVLP